MTRIAIVGHRALGRASTETFAARTSRALLEDAAHRWRDVSAVSALAEGADTIFAEAAVTLDLPLHVVTPFAGYEADFVEPDARRRHAGLHMLAASETRLPYRARTEAAYEAAMRWVVDTSDLVLAVWDGRPSAGPGGTADAVAHALATGRPLVHLDAAHHSVRTCGSWP